MVSAVGGQQSELASWHLAATRTKVSLAAVVGLLVAVVTGFLAPNRFAPMIGWDAAALTFLVWPWLSIWPRASEQTRQLATRDDPSRGVVDVILLSASVVSLVAVGVALFGASESKGAALLIRVLLGVGSVILSWAVVHSIFFLKYASLFYGECHGGIDFNSHDDPDYSRDPFTLG